MKILKINKIDNFGIFKNFDWSSNLANPTNRNQLYDFKDINIFYGRNYSGKTSLSKIIRALETKVISSKYQQPDFQITLADNENTVITQNSLSSYTHPIHVYNSDFVKENLKFIHDDTQDIESFSVTLGGGNQLILDRIQELKDELGSNEENRESGIFLDIKKKKEYLNQAILNYNTKNKAFEKILSDKTTKGQDSIKYQSIKYGDQNYDIRKLKSIDIPCVLKTDYLPLTDDIKTDYEKLILQIKKDRPTALLTFSTNFSNIVKAVESILKSQVGQSNKIKELVQNGTLNKWVEVGLEYHESRATCAFCANTISTERLESLRQHFDEESQKLKDRIQSGITQINQEKQKISNINFDINLFYDSFHPELNHINMNINSLIFKQNESFDLLISYLKDKQDKLFSIVNFISPIDYSAEIQKYFDDINTIRDKHIVLTDRLEQDQNNAKNALRLSHIYQFLQDIDYDNLTSEINILKQATISPQNELDVLLKRKDEIIKAIESKEDQLSSEGEACSRINNILQHDFGHQSLRLEPIEINAHSGKIIKFEIQRNRAKAHNLSEGECSLISFCYFLAKIQDDLDQDKKPIIWIDDPISSLDSNHVFFIYSLINDRICGDKKFLQLFISTHSLEFLKYLKRLDTSFNNNGTTPNLKIQKYLIQRQENHSYIKVMPIYMSEYATEFNYLFQQIHTCATADLINDQNYSCFYNFGNNARKFIEIYSFYKFPSHMKDDDRLKLFWNDNNLHRLYIGRINNELSHCSGVFERGMSLMDEAEMQRAAKAIIIKVQDDIRQYEALLESIDVTISNDPLHPDNQLA
ncbi:AAA family ATPase [Acinetobacter sp. R933-2]|uniref:AAA family ATPase n=1 Tax=Acinetobacter sp. R933-2 TaxID=2746728 RepID=UPI002578AC51|nr:AAA family ATPase [Acinetobacter sp. R933-2]MDM1248497.1 AAA family ATPase [Acinetobacter sp. R933-2]